MVHELCNCSGAIQYKVKKVQVKAGDIFEEKEINVLSSQMRQGIVDGIKIDVVNLSRRRV